MAILNPAPAQLGLASPALGPWFDDGSLQLAAPGARLSVPHTFAASGSATSTRWLPPAGGTLTVAVSTPVRPRMLDGLTDASGAPAFSDNSLVALFTLLPEVEERLEVLTAMLPRPDGGAVGGLRARARVRSLAIEFPDRSPARVAYFFHPSGSPTAADLGLEVRNGVLENGTLAMADLKQPGRTVPLNRQILATIPDTLSTESPAQIWAFDADGVAIDPGAVAAWWAAIAAGNAAPWGPPTPTAPDNSNLWADTLNTRTCNVANHLGLRFVNPHRGVVESHVRQRLSLPPANATQVGSNPDLFVASGNDVRIRFSGAPTFGPDTVPIPMVALLPIGNYVAAGATAPAAAPLVLWNTGAVQVPAHGGGNTNLVRDYVEVAVLDVESFVCGTIRGAVVEEGTPAELAAGRRAADQNRLATRINVTRSTIALQPTIDAVATAFNALPLPASSIPPQITVIAPAFDHDWGSRGVAGLPNTPPPTVLPALQCFALTGGGEAQGATAGSQQVVIRLTLPGSSNLNGAWVRIYPQAINLETGRREPQPGGAGRFGNAAATGNELNAHIVVTLPPGRAGGTAQLGVDVLVFTGAGAPAIYADQRIERPAAVPGLPLAMADVAATLGANALVLDCDQGVEFNPAGFPPSAVQSGSILVARVGNAFTAIDRSTVPMVWFDANTTAKPFRQTDVIALTTPAFAGQARGDTNPNDTANVTGFLPAVSIQPRNSVIAVGTPGAPFPTLERLELVGLRNAGTGGIHMAVVGSAPALSALHELLPTPGGNPGAPGGAEVHGAGVQITGGAITDVADFIRDRLITDTFLLAQNAGGTPLPTQVVGAPAAQWGAVLKTVARGVEGEVGMFELLDLADRTLLDNVATWPSQGLPDIGVLARIEDAQRAVCRRILNALGRQEALFALNAAINRAERLIYIETPAIDGEPIEADGASLSWLKTLEDRLGARPALHVALCVPRELLPGTPAPLTWVRNELWHEALARLLNAGGDRVAVFSPGAGPFSHVRLASTVVVVDDVWALVGTSHLWRRGLSFDSSLAVAVFDEANTFGRGAAVSAFRVQLAADRLGVTIRQIPLVAHEFVRSLKRLADGGGAGRLAVGAIARAPERPTESDMTLWNRDGSGASDFDVVEWLAGVAVHVTPS